MKAVGFFKNCYPMNFNVMIFKDGQLYQLGKYSYFEQISNFSRVRI